MYKVRSVFRSLVFQLISERSNMSTRWNMYSWLFFEYSWSSKLITDSWFLVSTNNDYVVACYRTYYLERCFVLLSCRALDICPCNFTARWQHSCELKWKRINRGKFLFVFQIHAMELNAAVLSRNILDDFKYELYRIIFTDLQIRSILKMPIVIF